MAAMTRRALVLVTTALASIGLLWQSAPSFGVPDVALAKGDRRFVPNNKNPQISFTDARTTVKKLIQSEMDMSEEKFGVKYSPQEAAQIQKRLWEVTQLSLIQHYVPKEQP